MKRLTRVRALFGFLSVDFAPAGYEATRERRSADECDVNYNWACSARRDGTRPPYPPP
ncbi:uncharacterized protein SOCEGT47_083270 [Sorangium cellulosum]|uniref:Uncharacterized protein n=1 Tax=Sorangium cellulosum TaxID=56 RepID=A0A4P2QDG8_SORCE|nr:uncharacterized protein SOCEGT47_083270 [Sorangium cellulosum]